ncbi:tandem-95 repeat protein [Acuticoccus mangrovi]|uniref:cellulase n=1 Tax=Acuticoccus mangrovi TaxID=2796142 RepID=A0A934MG11_9HYPH|nr:tandem-95 repeat protein [Acuticoccus mangrovi]
MVSPDPSDLPASLLTGKTFAALSTSGNRIVDQDGDAVTIKAINWWGLETNRGAPIGLEYRSIDDMLQQVVDLGFNTLRLPFSIESVLDPFEVNPAFPIDTTLNPELVGLNTLEIMEVIIDKAAEHGLSVILDNHFLRFTDGSFDGYYGDWREDNYTEADWIATWEQLADLFSDKANVIGADLRNEPYSATWDDMARAATLAGNAIQAIDDDWLIIVEGVQLSADGDWYTWGGNLKDVADNPVVLDVANKLVYSAHDYGDPSTDKLESSSYDTYYEIFRAYWGYVEEELGVPIFLGEFGVEDGENSAWSEALANVLMGDRDGDGVISADEMSVAGWAYWALNPGDSTETLTYSLLGSDFETVRTYQYEYLEALLAAATVEVGDGEPLPEDPAEPEGTSPFEIAIVDPSDWGNGAVFTVELTNTSDETITLSDITIAFDPDTDVTIQTSQVWGATVIDEDPDRPVFQLQTWNDGPTVAPGEVASFLFVLKYDGVYQQSSLGVDSTTFTVLTPRIDAALDDAPVVPDVDFALFEDVPTELSFDTLLADASDADGDTLTVVAVTDGALGTVSLEDSGLLYTPAADANGSDSFVFTVSDGTGNETTATVNVTVTAVNDAPTADGVSLETGEDAALTVPFDTLLAGAADVDGDTLTITGIGDAPGLGAVTIGADAIVYTPDADAFGSDAFSLVVSDGAGGTVLLPVSVAITERNDAPLLAPPSLVLAEDGTASLDVAALLAAASDADGDAISLAGVGGAAHGTVTLADGAIVYTPAANYAGEDGFTLTLADDRGATSEVAVAVTVTPVNDAPTADPIAITTSEDTPTSLDVDGVLADVFDAEGDALTITAVGGATLGTVALDGASIVYTPNTNASGDDVFTITISDGAGGTLLLPVSVTITPVNDAPTGEPIFIATLEDTPVTLDVATVIAGVSDIDSDTLSVTAVDGGSHGTVSLDGDVITYTPNADSTLADSFTVTVADGDGGVLALPVDVAVTAVNDAPTAQDVSLTTPAGTPVTIDLADFGAADVDGDSLSISAVAAGSSGTVAIEDGAVVYTPESGFAGEDGFEVTISDGNGGTVTADVLIEVSAPAASSAFDLVLTTVNDWGSGAYIRVDLTNSGSTDVAASDITITFATDYPVTIEPDQIWGGVEIANTGDSVTFQLDDAAPDGVFSPGETGKLDFVLDYPGTWNSSSLGVTLDDFAVEVAEPDTSETAGETATDTTEPEIDLSVTTETDWGMGAVIVITAENVGDDAVDVDDFAIAFDPLIDVAVRSDGVYGADTLSFDPDTPVFQLAPYDGGTSLAPGDVEAFTVVLDYAGQYGTAALNASDEYLSMVLTG